MTNVKSGPISGLTIGHSECADAPVVLDSRKLYGHPAWSGSQIRTALNQRLERAIIYDYIHNPSVDICAKWRPYVAIGDDIPTINGLPTPSRGGGKR